jgi:hypothetical protein
MAENMDYLFFEGKTAEGFGAMAISLEHHIRDYTPQTWTAPISNVAYIPTVLENEAETFQKLNEKGILESGLKRLGNCKESRFKAFNKSFYQSAIVDFFEKGLDKQYEL